MEVNPPHSGTDGRIAGAFARSAGGNIHLCHNGRIGGGRPGVGKRAFFAHYRGDLAQMSHRDGLVDVVDLGPIDSPDLLHRLSWYTGEVLRIKSLILGESLDADEQPDDLVEPPVFTPEFSGARKPFTIRATLEARADHGVVVDALAQSVAAVGHVVGNDRERDLFVLNSRGQLAILFEVKTDVSTTSIYTGVGQLLLNGGFGADSVRLVLVMPGKPDKGTRDALRAIGIEVLPYSWRGRTPLIAKPLLRRLIR